MDTTDCFRCNKCNRFLRPPISQCVLGHLLCHNCSGERGRCPKCREQYMPVLRMVGKVARTLEFPCPFSLKGCTKKLKWNEIDSHETDCEFGHYDCPEDMCVWKGPNYKVQEHFLEKHKELILNVSEDAVHFDVVLSNSYHKIYMVTALDRDFLLHLIRAAEESYTTVILQFVGADIDAEKYFYELEVHTSKGKLSFRIEGPVESNYNDVFQTTNKVGLFDYVFENAQSNCKLQIKSSKLRNQEMVLECPICTNKMTSSIFVCSNGHSLCGDCKNKLTDCPTCRVALGDTRNIALETILTEPGGVAVNLVDTNASEESSVSYTCPIKYSQDCSWTGGLDDIIPHARDEHIESVVSNGGSTLVYEYSPFIIDFSGKPFLFEDTYRGDFTYVTVRSYDDSNNYRYTIEFDDSGSSLGYSYTGICSNRLVPMDTVIDNGTAGIANRRTTEENSYGKITIEQIT